MRQEPGNEMTTDHSLAISIANRLAAKIGTSPTNLTPLYESINPDALDALFPTPGPSTRESNYVRFSHEGYTITVTGGGEIAITDASD